MPDPALILDSIFYDIEGIPILQGVYLRLRAGSVCGLFGRNGSGKSTLLRIAAAQIAPRSGHLTIDGRQFLRHRRTARYKDIAYLSQDSMLPKQLPVRKILAGCGRIAELRDDVILAPVWDTRVGHLSGGEERYLELQFILGLERRYVLLDEPFTGIALRIGEEMIHAIKAAAGRGSGTLISDHDFHTLVPMVGDAWLVHQKQCRHLDLGRDLNRQLHAYGYLTKRQAGVPDDDR